MTSQIEAKRRKLSSCYPDEVLGTIFSFLPQDTIDLVVSTHASFPSVFEWFAPRLHMVHIPSYYQSVLDNFDVANQKGVVNSQTVKIHKKLYKKTILLQMGKDLEIICKKLRIPLHKDDYYCSTKPHFPDIVTHCRDNCVTFFPLGYRPPLFQRISGHYLRLKITLSDLWRETFLDRCSLVGRDPIHMFLDFYSYRQNLKTTEENVTIQ